MYAWPSRSEYMLSKRTGIITSCWIDDSDDSEGVEDVSKANEAVCRTVLTGDNVGWL